MKSSSRREIHRRSLGNGRRRKSFLKGMQRRLFGEQLESRVLLAGEVLQNTDNPYDTDRNGVFSPADILHVINHINQGSAPASGEGEAGSSPTYYNDVNGDGFVSPIDALHGINEYSYRAEGEGELVSFRIQAVDVGTSNIINTSNPSGPNFHPVVKGTDYELRVIVDDLRLPGGPDGNPDGVYAAYMDLLYQKLNTVVEIQEIQTLTFGNNPEGGTFRLSFNALTTANITYSNPFAPNAEFTIAANIQTALDTTFGANRFLVNPVSAGDATQFSIRFMGQFGDTDVPLMTGNASLLTNSGGPAPTITFTERIKGVYSAESFLEAFRFGPQYQSGKEANDGQLTPPGPVDPNRIDEVGAFFTSTSGTTGPAPRELFRVRMNTINGGTVAFTGSLADILTPGHDTLVFAGGNSTRDRVDPGEIEIINSTPFTITEPFSAIADTFNFTEFSTSAVQSLTVKVNDTPQPLTGITISSISTTNISLGTLAIASGSNSINFTPLANVNGSANFTYTLRNASTGVTDTATVTINISAVNNAPVNTVPSVQTTAEETAKIINGISIADIDVSETVSAVMTADLTVQNGVINLASIPGGLVVNGNGTAAVNLQGSLADINTALDGLLYTPALDFVGSDTFRIITNDGGNTGSGGAKTDNDTVTITVTGVNDAPIVIVPGNDTVLEGDTLTITGTSTSDVDVGGAPLKVTLSVTGDTSASLELLSTGGITFVDGTANGQSTLAFTGNLASVNAALASFDYTPPLGDAGVQTITVSVNDQGASGAGPAGGLSDSDTINIDVIPLVRPFARRDPTTSNPASVAAFTVVEGSVNGALPVLDNDLVDDPDESPNPTIVTDKLLISVTDSAHGTTSISGDVVLYTPDADFWGTDTFTYVMNQDIDGNATPDGVNSTGTVTVTITNVNDAPVAVDSSDSTNEDTAKDIVLSVSDIDDNNNVGFISTLTPTVQSGPLHGTATPNPNGTIRYTPALDYNGPDEFTYTVSDGIATSAEVTVTITVNAINDNPVANNDVYAASEDVLLTVPVTTGVRNSNDNDNKDSNPVTNLTVELVSGPTNASSFNLNADGSFTYQGTLNFNGQDSFTYRLNDGQAQNNLSNVATVTINIGAVNDAPVANPESYLVEEDTLLNANNTTAGNPRATVRANDSDVDNTLSSLTVSLEPGMGPTHALSFALNADGSFTYQATLDYQGPDSFVYRLTDGGGLFSTATVSITVTEKNDPPVAVNDSYNAVEDVQLDVDTATGVRDGAGLDDDPDGNNPNSTLQVVLVSGPTHSSVFSLNTDGSFSYKAAANYNGPDSFTYKLIDPFAAESNIATVSINVAEVNDNPTANDDGSPADPLTLIKNTVANPFIDQEINVLANDSDDPDFNVVENLTIISAGGAGGATLHGTVTISADLKKVLYTPEQDYEGPDQFTYTISDGRTGEATATVYIEVVNFIPTDITGTVYVDSNNNGVRDSGEKVMAGVKITLEGHDDIFDIDFGADTDSNLTNDVAALVVYTDINGNYRFDAPGSLRPGMRPGSYTITEEQPEFMRDGQDQAGNDATLIANDRFAMTLPLLGIAGGINGNNFGERGLDPSVVSISEILASSTGNGLILAIDGSVQLWQLRLTGWTNLKSCTCTLSADTSSATFTFTDMQNNVYTRTISQVGNPRFRIMGRNADGDELIRLDGTAADFGLNLLAAGGNGSQPEGEADVPGDVGYIRGVDAVMAEVGNA